MPRCTPEQRRFIYDCHILQKTYPQLSLDFSLKFGVAAPTRKNCNSIVQRAISDNTYQNLNTSRSGRKRSGRSAPNIFAVMGDTISHPSVGCRRREAYLGIPKSTVHRILRIDLNLRPYHIQTHQSINTPDYQKRRDFANWYLAQQAANSDFEDLIVYTDESHVHLTGHINSHNAVHWGSTRPNTVNQNPLHSPYVTILGGITPYGLLGPYFFEDAAGNRERINATNYTDKLQNNLIPDLTLLTLTHPSISLPPSTTQLPWWFMQDGARPHISNLATNLITTEFGTQTIGERLAVHWPARSPDLTPCDFWLWGSMKDAIHHQGPAADLNEIKTRVRSFFAQVPEDHCRRAVQSVQKRCRLLLTQNGGHFEHLL